MKKVLLLLVCSFYLYQGIAQVGIGTTSPNTSSQLDISSTNKGALIPRMTTAQRKLIVDPAPGLLVFDLDKKTIYMFDGNRWLPLMFTTAENKLPPSPVIANDPADGDAFGISVSINGDYAIVGSIYEEDVTPVNRGAAYIFFRENGAWKQQAKLLASDHEASAQFGSAVDISGNVAIVGAPTGDWAGSADQGKAYVYVRSGTTWTQTGLLIPGDGSAGDHFGSSVSINGNFAVVGSPLDDGVGPIRADMGSAYIYDGTFGFIFGQGPQAKLTPSDGLASDNYGRSVDISGDYVIVGSPNDDGTFMNQGSVYIYFRGAGWVTGQAHQAKLTAADGAANDIFGYDVSIDGDYVLVGAPGDDVSSNVDQGSAYIFFRGGGWASGQLYYGRLIASDGAASDGFGLSVNVEGMYFLVGAPDDTIEFSEQGSAYLWKLEGGSLVLVRKIFDESAKINSFYGGSVAMDLFNIVIGAPFKSNTRGEVYFLNIE